MNICFHDHAWEDYVYWQRTDKKILKRINTLITAIRRDPFGGIGKPEELRFDMSGYWSRRIDQEHRLVYRVEDGQVVIVQCRYHY